jgi:hypothetical protein
MKLLKLDKNCTYTCRVPSEDSELLGRDEETWILYTFSNRNGFIIYAYLPDFLALPPGPQFTIRVASYPLPLHTFTAVVKYMGRLFIY